MSFKKILIFFLWLLFSILNSEPHSMNGTIYYDSSTGNYSIKLGVIDCINGLACGFFNDSLNETGWSILEIKIDSTNSKVDATDYERLYAAGMLEGYLSSYEIYYAYVAGWKGYESTFRSHVSKLENWTNTQRQWMEKQISLNSNDIYWQYVNVLTAQYDGQVVGYNMAAPEFDLPSLDDFAFQFLSGNQDLWDVIKKIDPSTRPKWNEMTKEEFFMRSSKNGRCSSIVKITPLIDNIYFAHSTWSEYFWMNRIYKHYIFDLEMDIPTKHMAMSSYPGSLSSIDDYYLMDSGLAVTETTNSIYNTPLFDLLSPDTLFTWQRARIACALAKTSKEFVDVFAKYNSGTYNNQWIVLNWGIFQPNQPLPDDLLWITEQIPGNCSSMDVTDVLERGYWASYNVPAIPYIYEVSGNAEAASLFGTSNSYDLAPRARIFRRDGNAATNLTSIEKLMRYNNYKADSIENNDPMWAIMSRNDLSIIGTDCFGGIDTKLSDYNMLKSVQSMSQAGPTHDNLSPFEWAPEWDQYDCPHIAMPHKYDFDWILMDSQLK